MKTKQIRNLSPSPPTVPKKETQSTCTHQRLVDEVRTKDGVKTGKLMCKECLAIFPDPMGKES